MFQITTNTQQSSTYTAFCANSLQFSSFWAIALGSAAFLLLLFRNDCHLLSLTFSSGTTSVITLIRCYVNYLRSIGASSEWVTHDSPTPCTIRESDTVWVLVYCSPSMMHKIGAICTHPMRFALSSIREENCNADRATTTTTPYREHATCGTLICCSNSSYPRMAPIVCALIFRWSLLPKQGASADRKLHATYAQSLNSQLY